MSDELSNHTINKLANITEEQIKTPHSSVGSFVLPSGVYTDQGELIKDITVKEMSGNEEEILASTKVSATEKVNTLLSNCLIRLGPIEDRAEIKQLVKHNMLASDRVFLLIAIRRVTLGDSYTFADKCPSEECEQESLYTVDLGALEPINAENAAKRVREATLPSGKAVKWHYLSGRDEERQVKHKEDQTSVGIWARLDLLNGTPPTIKDVKNLSQRDRQYLRELFDETEPSLDTSTDMECPVCNVEFTKQLDLNPSFFYPSRAKKTSKKRSSS